MQDVYEFLKKCGIYYIATVDGDQPKVRPFGTINMFEGKLYIQTGKSKEISSQIKQNPKIEICALLGSDWLRVQATAIEDERIEAKQDILNKYPSLAKMYKADDDNTQVFYLSDVSAAFCSFTSETRIVKF